MDKAIYLDNAATTQMTKEVAESVMLHQTARYGNASSLYTLGDLSAKAVDKARGKIAGFLGVKDDEFIFTSGGTESNNTALRGVLVKGDHLIVSSVEHDSVLKVAQALEKEGVELTVVGVDKEGKVAVADVEKAIKENTKLVSIMHANNEVGTLQDIDAIGKVCKAKGVLFHTDCVQSLCKLKIPLENVDMASFSAHKIHGPKGVGGLFVRKGTALKPLLIGGGHEFGLRSGTENVPGIVGFGTAVKMIDSDKVSKIRDSIVEGVLKIKGSWLNGGKDTLCTHAHFGFKGLEGEAIVLKLDEHGIMASTGSACSTKSLDPSHVLIAMGLSKVEAHGSLRVSISSFTKEEDVTRFVEVLKTIV